MKTPHIAPFLAHNQVLTIIQNALNSVDPRLVSHGDRVAHIACAIADHPSLAGIFHRDTLILLCMFHDIGAYKTEDIDSMMVFETVNVRAHAVYGYLFLKYFSPMADFAEAILYHHSPESLVHTSRPDLKPYACLIHLADRIDVLLSGSRPDTDRLFAALASPTLGLDPTLIGVFREVYPQSDLYNSLKAAADSVNNLDLTHHHFTGEQPVEELLELVVYSIDFRSTTTVVHAITTTWVAYELACFMGLSPDECDEVYVGALLHDIGKIAVPVEILEYNGPLNRQQMEIMKGHVSYSEALIRGNISEKICRIAIRHHEKLDGSGYPYGLSGEHLTRQERLVAVADIVSALQGKRSYKESFSKETTLSILSQLKDDGKLDAEIVEILSTNFDLIMAKVTERVAPILENYACMSKEYLPCLAALNAGIPYDESRSAD